MLTERQMEQAAKLDENIRQAGCAGIARAMLGAGNEHCADCEEPIAQARRAAAPWATRCAECQAVFESKQKRGLR